LRVGKNVRIELKQVSLDEGTKLKIRLSRFIRKYLQKMGKMKPIEEMEKLNELERLDGLEKKV
jgi:predicted DNA-binding antitoxin AbrB/MazE fold protein